MDALRIHWDTEFDGFKSHWLLIYQQKRDEFLYQLELELTVYIDETLVIYQAHIDA